MKRRRVSQLFAAAAVLASCRGTPEPAKTYHLTGTIVRLHPVSRLAVIRHEAIRGADGKVWMEAMTMEFPVRDPAGFAQLRDGQRIRAEVHQRESDFDYWIDHVQIENP